MNTLAQSTATRLSQAITTAPGAMRELMARHGCEVPATPESLALLADVQGDAFTDDLFIVLRQAERASSSRFAGATGTDGGPATSQQRSALGRGLQAIAEFVKSALTTKMAGTAGGVNYDATNDPDEVETPAPRILGLAQPVFIAGLVVLLLAAVVLLMHHQKK